MTRDYTIQRTPGGCVITDGNRFMGREERWTDRASTPPFYREDAADEKIAELERADEAMARRRPRGMR